MYNFYRGINFSFILVINTRLKKFQYSFEIKFNIIDNFLDYIVPEMYLYKFSQYIYLKLLVSLSLLRSFIARCNQSSITD